MGFQTKALSFQRDGAAACKRVQQLRRVTAGRFHNFGFRFIQHFFIVGIFPLDQVSQNTEKPVALLFLRFYRRELVRVGRRVVHKRCPNHGPRSRKRPACPPKVQRGRMPVPDGLFAGGRFVDGFERKRDFNQLFWHFLCFPYRFSIICAFFTRSPRLTLMLVMLKSSGF